MSRFDVAIVGGGPAGLAAALVLGRMRRRVLLLDADDPAHAPSEGVRGLFGHDGTPPLELRQIAREQLRPYDSVTVRMVAAEAVRKTPSGFTVLADGEEDSAGVLLLCTGVRYELPPIEGAAEVWARGVFHCPYCHGWEVRDRPLAAYGADAAGLALMLTSLSDDVVLLTNGDSNLDLVDASELEAAGVVIRDDPVARLESEDGRLARIRFADGSSDDRAGLFYAPEFTPSPLPALLGCELDEKGSMVIDEDGRTSVPGVFGAGDATVGKAAVVLAAAAGSRAAYAINAGLAHGTLPRGRGSHTDRRRTMTATTNPNRALWENGDFTQIAATMRQSVEPQT
jgi:thioredoxin reductase